MKIQANKLCSRCKKHPSNSSGYCIQCNSLRMKKWHQENPDYQKRYRRPSKGIRLTFNDPEKAARMLERLEAERKDIY